MARTNTNTVKMDEIKPLYSEVLEEYIMNVLLTHSEFFHMIISELKEENFYTNKYRNMFNATMKVFSEINRPVSYIDLLGEYIKRQWDISSLLNMQNLYYSTFDIKNAILQLKDITATNKLIDINRYIKDSINKGDDWYDVCTKALTNMQLLEMDYSKSITSLSADIDNLIGKITSNVNYKVQLKLESNLISNIVDLSPNNLIFFGASPKAGKTRVLSWIILQLLKNNDISVLWFSGEDPKENILRYLLSMESKIPDHALSGKRKHTLDVNELTLISNAQKFFHSIDLQIIDEPTPIDMVMVKFSTFVSKRKGKICLLVYDNFNIARDQLPNSMNELQKEGYVSSMFQKINTINNRNGKTSLTIVVDHLNKDYLRRQSLEEGYRPRMEHLKGTSRKYEVITQMWFLNKPSLYKDLVNEEKDKPNILVNGESIPRKDILKRLVIFEVAANRNDSVDDDDNTIVRLYTDFNTMEIMEWKADMREGKYEVFPERNITRLTEEQCRKEMLKIPNPDTPEKFISAVNYILGSRTEFDELITLDFLFNKYHEYYESLRDYQNGAYTKKGKDIVSFPDFVFNGYYNKKWETVLSSHEKNRDWYLYGIG